MSLELTYPPGRFYKGRPVMMSLSPLVMHGITSKQVVDEARVGHDEVHGPDPDAAWMGLAGWRRRRTDASGREIVAPSLIMHRHHQAATTGHAS